MCVSGSGGQCRGRGAYLVAVLVLVGLPVGPCACWVPVGACWVLVCLPVARGCAGVPARGPWVCWLACLVACMLVRLPVVSWLKDAQIHPKTYARACHSAATSRAMCTIQAH